MNFFSSDLVNVLVEFSFLKILLPDFKAYIPMRSVLLGVRMYAITLSVSPEEADPVVGID